VLLAHAPAGARRRFARGTLVRCRLGAYVAMATLWFVAANWGLAAEKPAAAGEYPLKAVFLLKFIKFVEWPARAFPAPDAPIVVGIIGDDPFGPVLDRVFKDETVQNRAIVVKRLSLADNLNSCHALFFSHSVSDHIATLVDQVGDSPVLTIGDTPRFAERGLVANLVLADDIIKLEINQTAAKRAGLQISSKLLNLDRVVKLRSERPKTRL